MKSNSSLKLVFQSKQGITAFAEGKKKTSPLTCRKETSPSQSSRPEGQCQIIPCKSLATVIVPGSGNPSQWDYGLFSRCSIRKNTLDFIYQGEMYSSITSPPAEGHVFGTYWWLKWTDSINSLTRERKSSSVASLNPVIGLPSSFL